MKIRCNLGFDRNRNRNRNDFVAVTSTARRGMAGTHTHKMLTKMLNKLWILRFVFIWKTLLVTSKHQHPTKVHVGVSWKIVLFPPCALFFLTTSFFSNFSKKHRNFFNEIDCKKFSKSFYSQFDWKKFRDFFRKFEKNNWQKKQKGFTGRGIIKWDFFKFIFRFFLNCFKKTDILYNFFVIL